GAGERVSFGMVSGTERAFRGPRGRRIKGSIEHTAPLPRGSSGSPLVTGSGAVVGLNTNRLGDGFYLAIPADRELRDRLAALATGRSRSRRRLGVGLAPATVARALRRSVGLDERDGLLVRVVEDGSTAGRPRCTSAACGAARRSRSRFASRVDKGRAQARPERAGTPDESGVPAM